MMPDSAGLKLTRRNQWAGLLVVAVLYVLLVSEHCGELHDSSIRPRIARAMYDQRSIGLALQSYYDAEGRYPGWAGDPPTFALPSLTTPVAYMISYPKDIFAKKDRTFCYYTDPAAQGWILWSPGPDKDLDLNGEAIRRIYRAGIKPDDPKLLSYAYDPTNGINSSGDIYRVMMKEYAATSPLLSR